MLCSICSARLVRCLLGKSAIADRKLECGNPLTILGISVALKAEGICFRPEPVKVRKWLAQIQGALKSNWLGGATASQLAGKHPAQCALLFMMCVSSFVCTGRLSWSCQFAFKRLGRAMMTPIYAQKTARRATLSKALRLALHWWKEVLEQHLGQLRPWAVARTPAVHLLCDARSTPPRVAAVLMMDGDVFYSDAAPPECILSSFRYREDNQITSLEILSIAFG